MPAPRGISVGQLLVGRWRGGNTVLSAAGQASRVGKRSLRAVVMVVPGSGRMPGPRRLTLLTVVAVVSRMPSVCPVWLSFYRTIPDPPSHGVVGWEDHTPGVCHMCQQQLREIAMCSLIPVYAVAQPMLPCMAEVEVEIQHIEAMPRRLLGAVKVGLHHIFTQA